jgi:hypothetical protein
VPEIPNSLPNCKFDLTAAILVSYLYTAMNNSMGGIRQYFREILGIPISKGTICNMQERLKEYLGGEYLFLEKKIEKAKARYRDETGWRKNGKTIWNWVVAAKEAVVYRLERSRCHSNALKLKGSGGVDISDGYQAYSRLEGERQRCWAHLLRLARNPEHPFALQQEIREYEKLVSAIGEIYHNAKEERKAFGCSADLRAKYDRKLSECLLQLCWHSRNSNKLINYIMNSEKEWFAFLEFPDVEPTNNMAERALRHIVIKRKISQQSRGQAGMESYAMQASLYMTARQNGENYMDYLRGVVEDKLHDGGKY